ncbi:MAG: RNA polymerase sigma factor [Polyangiales bacterium]
MEARALLETLTSARARFVRFARGRVGSEADAEDIVQRALARAAERAELLDDPAKAHAWFYRILRRAIADHLRGGVSDPMQMQGEADLDELPESIIDAIDTACACGPRLLEDIRPAYREIVRRIDLEGEDPIAVATDLGITLDNLQVRLHRARRSLRRDVQNYCGVSSARPCLDCACDGGHRCGEHVAPARDVVHFR